MFGFLRGNHLDRSYRQIYAECCNAHRRRFGVDSLLFLSYESIFLYVLAVDSESSPKPPAPAVTCCRLRSRTGNWPDFDQNLAAFCNYFALLLASIKLDDDVRDDRSILARFTRWHFRRRFTAAKQYFNQLDPQFESRVEEFMERHLQLEQRTHGGLSLDEYVAPTAEAFGYLFALFGRLMSQEPQVPLVLEKIGKDVGAAIVAFDCAVDFKRDNRLGHFNPLDNRRDVGRAFDFAQRCLSRAGWECVRAFGDESIAVGVTRFNFDRVARQQSGESLRSRQALPASLLGKARWTLRRGDCDCLCDPSCCDAGGCDCDGANSAGCCCDCADPCLCWGGNEEKGKKGHGIARAKESSLVGMSGHAIGPLNPSGFVSIGEKRLPAQSQGEWIDDETEIVVIADESFGVTVTPKD